MALFSELAKFDPTKTTTLRKRFASDLVGRFSKLARDVRETIVENDAFGINAQQRPNVLEAAGRRAFYFSTDAEKVNGFMKWLRQNQESFIFQQGDVEDAIAGDWWADKYIDSAYKRGLANAYIDASRIPDLKEKLDGLYVDKEQFLSSSFFQPIHSNAVKTLYSRAFTELQGITEEMDRQISRVLSRGLINGDDVRTISRAITDRIDKIGKTRARMLARTEIIRSHADAQLNAYESWGIRGVSARAEWSTAGDAAVCEMCLPLEGTVMTISEARNMIPRHPNCRCSWIPASVGEKDTVGQKRGAAKVGAVEASLDKEGRERSTWPGKEKKFRTGRKRI